MPLKQRVTPAVRLVAVASVLAAVGTLASAGPAAAAVHASNTYVDGSADWSWGNSTLTNVDIRIVDQECNGVPVYVRLRVYNKAGNYVSGTRRYNYLGCGLSNAQSYDNLTWTSSEAIAGVVVHACEEPGVNCVSSSYHDNPNN